MAHLSLGACQAENGPAWLESAHVAEYVNCFAEPTCGDPYQRAMTFLGFDNAMSVQKCVALAHSKGFAYAAVQWISACFGGNDISQYTTITTCDARCSGSADACGGSCANAIYVVPMPGEKLGHQEGISMSLSDACFVDKHVRQRA